jgi:hypothetical protein
MSAVPITATVERRLLLNYRADPDVAAALLPTGLRPRLVGGGAVVGICVLSLSGIRPLGLPRAVGIHTDNAAHRIGVEWDTPEGVVTGVYVPRRVTTSRLTAWVGGRLFPGVHTRVGLVTEVDGLRLRVSLATPADDLSVRAVVTETDNFTSGLFADLAEASAYFEAASIGWSPDHRGRLEGMVMQVTPWSVRPVVIESLASTWFDDPIRFPPGTLEPDCGLVMEALTARWDAIPTPNWARSATQSVVRGGPVQAHAS